MNMYVSYAILSLVLNLEVHGADPHLFVLCYIVSLSFTIMQSWSIHNRTPHYLSEPPSKAD